ncbi:MAG: hypothetical protein WDN25_26045 [Acetobacteraceae bacterium]
MSGHPGKPRPARAHAVACGFVLWDSSGGGTHQAAKAHHAMMRAGTEQSVARVVGAEVVDAMVVDAMVVGAGVVDI